jgi:hypothetical protein
MKKTQRLVIERRFARRGPPDSGLVRTVKEDRGLDESWACFYLSDSRVSTAAGCASHRRANANKVYVASYDAIDVRVLVGAFATKAWSEREQHAYDEPRRRSADLFWTFIRTGLCDKRCPRFARTVGSD